MYNSLKGMLREVENFNGNLAELIIANEISKTEKTREDVIAEMTKRRGIMKDSSEAATGRDNDLQKTFISGMSADQQEYTDKNDTLCGSLVNKAMAKALSCSEVNAAMGVICATPTAGSSGTLPGVLFLLEKRLNLTEEQMIRFLFTAGGFGMVIANNAEIAGATGGCQAEVGSASAMGAAAAVEAAGGTAEQSAQALSIAMSNLLGLVCDPIAGLVEVPCVKRNAIGAGNALIAADMALAGCTSVIPADECIDAMKKVGHQMPASLRETGIGGLAGTPTGQAIKAKIFGEDA